ncbi:MAG: hypothetical protein ACKVOT_08075 [Polaromonas sp.]
MTGTSELIPALKVIESGLFPDALHPGAGATDTEATPTADDALQVPPLSANMQQLMVRRVESNARTSDVNMPLQPGQIRWLQAAPGSEWPLAMLVGATHGPRVQGWLVASEALYASPQDWLLQDTELRTAADPRCAMVQLWNPLDLDITVANPLGNCAGELTAEAFSQLGSVALQIHRPAVSPVGVAPAPGRFGLHDIDGVAFVCGSPLGPRPSSDVRHRYRYLYLLWAQQLQRQHGSPAAAALPAAANLPFWRRRDTWRGAGLAAVLMLAVALPLSWLSVTDTDTSSTRNAGQPTSNFGLSDRFVVMDVQFSRSATLRDITDLLQTAQAEIVAGPLDSGAYRVAFDIAQRDTALLRLNNPTLVVSIRPAER